MTNSPILSELDVLIPVAKWLLVRGVCLVKVSPVVPPGGSKYDVRRLLTDACHEAGAPTNWQISATGADIIGLSNTESWDIECKGAGTGVQSTQRNNFDRALASAVSYYGGSHARAAAVPPEHRYIGLALPATRTYRAELTRRVRSELRARLNLWVFLVNVESGQVTAVTPTDEYPVERLA